MDIPCYFFEPLRPPLTYCELINESINMSTNKMLTLAGIHEFIANRYPFYASEASPDWKASIKNTLTEREQFVMVQDNELGDCWIIDPYVENNSEDILENLSLSYLGSPGIDRASVVDANLILNFANNGNLPGASTLQFNPRNFKRLSIGQPQISPLFDNAKDIEAQNLESIFSLIGKPCNESIQGIQTQNLESTSSLNTNVTTTVPKLYPQNFFDSTCTKHPRPVHAVSTATVNAKPSSSIIYHPYTKNLKVTPDQTPISSMNKPTNPMLIEPNVYPQNIGDSTFVQNLRPGYSLPSSTANVTPATPMIYPRNIDSLKVTQNQIPSSSCNSTTNAVPSGLESNPQNVGGLTFNQYWRSQHAPSSSTTNVRPSEPQSYPQNRNGSRFTVRWKPPLAHLSSIPNFRASVLYPQNSEGTTFTVHWRPADTPYSSTINVIPVTPNFNPQNIGGTFTVRWRPPHAPFCSTTNNVPSIPRNYPQNINRPPVTQDQASASNSTITINEDTLNAWEIDGETTSFLF